MEMSQQCVENIFFIVMFGDEVEAENVLMCIIAQFGAPGGAFC
jgi:hypothetical protein